MTTHPTRRDNELIVESSKSYIPLFITKIIYRKTNPYLDKHLLDVSEQEVLPPDYQAYIDAQEPWWLAEDGDEEAQKKFLDGLDDPNVIPF
jgi:hypothetical protein